LVILATFQVLKSHMDMNIFIRAFHQLLYTLFPPPS